VSNRSDQYVIYLKQCFPSLCYKRITVFLKALVNFRENYLISNQLHPTPSAKPHRHIWKLMVSGRKKVQDQPSVQFKSFFCSSISCLVTSNTYLSRNPHKNISFYFALILCESFCICISRGWSVFKRLQSRERV